MQTGEWVTLITAIALVIVLASRMVIANRRKKNAPPPEHSNARAVAGHNEGERLRAGAGGFDSY